MDASRDTKKVLKDRRPRISLLPSLHADWYVLLVLGLAVVGYAAYRAETEFRAVSSSVSAAESQREGRATLVVPEATETLRALGDRARPKAAGAAASSTAAAATTSPQR